MKKITQCHKCPYNLKHSEFCLSCDGTEQYDFRFEKYIKEGYDFPQPQQENIKKMNTIDEDVEQNFKNKLIEIFSLSPNELLILQSIMQQKSLSEFAEEMKKMVESNRGFSRNRAYETRKTIITKLPWIKPALLTKGQRKVLKERSKN